MASIYDIEERVADGGWGVGVTEFWGGLDCGGDCAGTGDGFCGGGQLGGVCERAGAANCG